jgi:zinc transporter ZupT
MPETLERLPAPAGVQGERAHTTARRGIPLWVKGVAPLVLLAALIVLLLRVGPLGVLRASFPPVEELTIESVRFPAPGEMVVRVVNGGPEAVTIAQVLVDDAAWQHTLDGDRTIARLESREVAIPYPWVEGEPHVVKLVSSTGLTFEHEVAVATQTPRPDATYLGTFALLGIYVGVIPVFLGILWLPFIRAVSRRWVDFFLALTLGLLVFLGVDALVEGIESSARVATAFQGIGLLLIGVVGTPLAIQALGSLRPAERRNSGFAIALLIAIAIGLHNFGEGLAIGAAYASGAIALGTVLVLGFLIHNTTEGLGIVAPLAHEPTTTSSLALLGGIAGLPTVAGAWIGGFIYSALWTTLFLAIGAGAIAQVVWILGRRLLAPGANRTGRGIAAGFLCGLLIMYVTGMLVAA